MQWWYEFEMPEAVVRPHHVSEHFAAAGVPDSLKGIRFVALCRDLEYYTAPYAEMLVEEVLERREAADLVLVAPPEEFLAWCERAAARREMAGRALRLKYDDLVA